jgi:hypothetical protein
MLYWTIDYDECKQTTYRKIKVTLRDKNSTVLLFDTGNFIVDYYHFQEFQMKVMYDLFPEGFSAVHSSSVDHFFMDGELYHERYFDGAEAPLFPFKHNDPDFLENFDKYLTVAALPQHKNFKMVKDYVKRMEKKMGWSNKVVIEHEAEKQS